ncbi:hypothetical protein GGR92_005235 [Spirosoma lacussanchae]|uniref:ADP-ribosyltransferase n=1 Tax=Spirosoma lacussanchae TaxID=1884249 RepID=UPI00110876BB|nr:ADP-ribosyltransferase [Spirosoma lacussanchae]
MKIIREYTKSAYRDINRNLRNGIVTEQAAELVEAVSKLPQTPAITYRAFWMDDIGGYVQWLRSNKVITFDAFTSTSRDRRVANDIRGNVMMTITGKTGRDIVAYSKYRHEQEVLYLPGLRCRITKLNTVKVAGKLWSVTLELKEVEDGAGADSPV